MEHVNQAQSGVNSKLGQLRSSYGSDHMGQHRIEEIERAEIAAQRIYQEQVVETCGDLQHITDRINVCIDNASKAAERVSIVAVRVKGGISDTAPNHGLASGGPGAICEIHSRLDVLTNMLAAVHENIERLELL